MRILPPLLWWIGLLRLSLSWAWQPSCEYHDRTRSPWPFDGTRRASPLPRIIFVLHVESSENDSGSGDEEPTSSLAPTTRPPQSRLARLAEDWLMEEEEEQDEWISYWQKFDEKTTLVIPPDPIAATGASGEEELIIPLTTEERLERYLDSRGIRRKEEQLHQTEIETAIQLAQKATTAQEALVALESVQPWLQVHTRLGGLALIEYMIAQWQLNPTWIDQEQELCRALLQNPHEIVVSKMKQLLKRQGPPPRQPSFWTGIFSKDGASGWW